MAGFELSPFIGINNLFDTKYMSNLRLNGFGGQGVRTGAYTERVWWCVSPVELLDPLKGDGIEFRPRPCHVRPRASACTSHAEQEKAADR